MTELALVALSSVLAVPARLEAHAKGKKTERPPLPCHSHPFSYYRTSAIGPVV